MKIDRRESYYILAGSSGTEKTTALEQLRNDGFNCVEEAPRSILTEQLLIQGPGLPSNNPLLFIQMMMDRNINGFERSKPNIGPTFFDRGMPDLIHYAIRFNVELVEFEKASKEYLYNKTVFVFPPWKEIFVNDSLRGMTFEKSVEFHELLMKIYQRLNYDLISVPFDTSEARSKFILDRVKMKDHIL